MAASRAAQVWNGSTTTGASTRWEGGVGHTRIALYLNNASTKSFTYSVVGSVGASTATATLIAAATSTGANVTAVSTGTFVFDTAWLDVSANATTGVVKAWLAGA